MAILDFIVISSRYYCSCITHSWVNNSWSFTVNFWGHRFYYENPRRENDEQSIVKASDEKKKDSPRLVRGVLIDNNEYDKSFNLKRCIPVIMIRTDKLDKYTISNDTEVITVSDTYEHHLITFMVCDESLYSIFKVPGKFWYNDDLGVILGFGNKEIDKFVEKLKTPIITV